MNNTNHPEWRNHFNEWPSTKADRAAVESLRAGMAESILRARADIDELEKQANDAVTYLQVVRDLSGGEK